MTHDGHIRSHVSHDDDDTRQTQDTTTLTTTIPHSQSLNLTSIDIQNHSDIDSRYFTHFLLLALHSSLASLSLSLLTLTALKAQSHGLLILYFRATAAAAGSGLHPRADPAGCPALACPPPPRPVTVVAVTPADCAQPHVSATVHSQTRRQRRRQLRQPLYRLRGDCNTRTRRYDCDCLAQEQEQRAADSK